MTPYIYEGKSYPVYEAEDFPVESVRAEWSHADHNTRKKKKYFLEFGAFDIETTSHIEYLSNGDVNPDASYGYMYIWQACIDYKLCVGRYWADFLTFLKRLSDVLPDNDALFIFYVHNLSFEFQFMHGIFRYFGYEPEFFAITNRRLLSMTVKELKVQFRCSMRLTGSSLANFIKDTPGALFPKLKGELDYLIERTPLTKMKEEELAYCYHDVLGLYDALRRDMDATGDDIATIPLTQTGYIRRMLKGRIKPLKWYRALLLASALRPRQYKMVKALARGGDTLASMSHPLYTVLHNLDSWDIKSSHPTRLFEKYPIGRLDYEGKDLTLDKIHAIRDEGRWYMARFLFVGLDLKDYTQPIPALMESKAEYGSRGWKDSKGNYTGPIVYNGRLCAASSACFCLDRVTFEMVEEQYTWKKLYIDECYSSNYDYLPQVVRDFVRDLFYKKCELEIERAKYEKYTPEWYEADRHYMRAKQHLNGIFGMFYTDPLRESYTIEKNGAWAVTSADYLSEDEKTRKEAEEKLFRSQAAAVGEYLWGVHTAALSRRALDTMIKTIGYAETVYSDTDSDKAFSNPAVDKRVAALNRSIEANSRERGAFCTVAGRDFVLGVVEKETEDEPYSEFITGGAKKYCYRDRGKLHFTIAGVSRKYTDRKGGEHENIEQLKDDIQNFRPGMIFNPAGGKVLHYRDEEAHYQKVTGDDGTSCEILIAGSIYMTDRKVTLGSVFDTRGKRSGILSELAELENSLDKEV